MPVLATMLAGGLLALAAYASTGLLAVAVVGLAAVLAYGLVDSGDLPDQVAASLLVILTAVGAVVSVLASDAEPGAELSFAPVLRAAGPATVAVLLVVVARPAARERAVDWLTVTGAAVLIAALGGAFVAVGRLDDLGPELVAITAAAAVVGSAVAVRPAHRLGWLWSLGWLAVGAVAEFAVPIGRVEETDRLAIAIAVALVAGLAASVAAGSPRTHGSSAHWSNRAARVAGVVLALAAPVAATTVRVLLA